MSNAINPEHYNRLNPQPKDVIRAWGLNFNLGSAVKFICDRGVSHEIVRHRVASYAQESTRYCNYNKSGDVAFIRPVFLQRILQRWITG